MNNDTRILIAGVGNIFLGDDGFGVELARVLAARNLPAGVVVMDFGIRSYDLAYALTEDVEAIILIDAVPRRGAPGTVYLIEPALEELCDAPPAHLDGHSLDMVSALRMAQGLGGVRAKLYLVGCEPAVLECESGEIGLSEPVRAAIPQALALIESLVSKLSGWETKTEAGLVPR